jgi:late competence development protein ComFB
MSPAASWLPMENALEDAVHEVFFRLRDMEAGYCHCAQCKDDVITHALNHAKPRYISGAAVGSAVTRVALTRDQAQAEVAVLVLEAMRRVQRNPRHGPEAFVPPGVAVR